jgi:propionyl-CoA synthetase
LLIAVLDKSRRELNWNALVRSCRLRRGPVIRPPFPRTAEIPGTGKKVLLGEALRATDPHYILHTSGTTGMPKGVVRPMSHLVGLQYVLKELFGFDQNSVMFCASDIGWVVGHAFIVYAPLLLGAATVLYEGKPVGTPDASQFWRVVEEYKVTALFCAPSALRAVVREDPGLKGVREGELGSLKGLFLAGERSEPALVERFREVLGGKRVVDNWWSTESGSPITGTLPHQEIRPGSAGKPLPGWDVRVVSDDGELLPPGTMGNVVLAMPLSPTAMVGLWGDGKGERLRRSYWERFAGRWMDTGDIGVVDAEGYVTILARGDDVIKVAAHRLGTAVIEGAVAAVRGVREAFVVPLRDAIKGQVPVAFVVLAEEEEEEEGNGEGNDGWKERVKAAVRKEVGAIAGLKDVVSIPAAAVPRTRSGKVVRRAFRGLLEGEVVVPEGVGKEVWDVAVMRAREMGLVGGVVVAAKL